MQITKICTKIINNEIEFDDVSPPPPPHPPTSRVSILHPSSVHPIFHTGARLADVYDDNNLRPYL